MANEVETEAVLTPEDLRSILKVCSTKGVLVGGQALAFWADHFVVSLPDDLAPAVSADADFIADANLARKLARALGWKSWIPGFEDATFQTGKVTQKQPDGSIKQVDFLASVAGMVTADVVNRAIEMEVPEIGRLRVMHPIDVLESRIQNLALIPAKRTQAGVSQAQLAIDVARKFVAAELVERGEKKALKLLERVVAIANEASATRVFLKFEIHTRRWPRIGAAIAERREKLRRQLSRRKRVGG
jgi:hypothetical protein